MERTDNESIPDEYQKHIEAEAKRRGENPEEYSRKQYEGHFISGTGNATHEEVCNKALEDYEKHSNQVHSWNSLIPKAIEFFRDHGDDVCENTKNEQVEISAWHSRGFLGFIDTLLTSPSIILDDDHEWGYQVRMANTSLYCAKLLVLLNDTPGSFHYHKIKSETFVCLSGRVEISEAGWSPLAKALINNGTVQCGVGDKRIIPPKTYHQMQALEFPCIILEVSTHDDDGDIVRI